MHNLWKREQYQLSHNLFYWCGLTGIFLLGFFTADTYLPEVMGPAGGPATSLSDIFNGMVYDSTFLLIITSSVLSLLLGQEFSCRTIALEVSAGHSRKTIFASKILVYLLAFHIMALLYPIAGCIREFQQFGIPEAGTFLYNVIKASAYSFLLNSVVYLTAILICCHLRNATKAVAATAVVTFVLSLYLGYGMMLKLPVFFLPTYQIREVISKPGFLLPSGILVGIVWIVVLVSLSWKIFRKCDLR